MNKFSVKKLLLTILCSIIVTTFLGTTYLFLSNLPGWIESEILSSIDGDSQILKQIGYGFADQTRIMKESVAEDKEIYGQDYPSEEIFLYRVLVESRSYEIVRMFVLTLVMGIILGTIIYIVAIQNAKGKKLVIELLVAFVIIFVVLIVSNTIYEAFLNNIINQYNTNVIEYQTYIYDLENQNILIPYIISIAIVYIGNMIYQKRQANKLNKELNKK